MARLFTAIELSPPVRGAIVERQARIHASLRAAGGGDLRLVPPHQLHLTLVFIGEVDEARVIEIESAAAAPLPIAPFDVLFGECGVFPPRGAPRVLWIGVARGATELTELHRLVCSRVERAGLPRERRPFRPHLTIGRWRDGAPPLDRRVLPTAPWSISQHVDSIALFRSRLLPSGAEHSVIARTSLTGQPGALH
jgi:2'-5' RNA ligase